MSHAITNSNKTAGVSVNPIHSPNICLIVLPTLSGCAGSPICKEKKGKSGLLAKIMF